MEQSLSSLTFTGSITEAIVEAKKQRKLFVVYVSGDNAESSSLENSTWTDAKVAESVSKYCILLHIHSGSTDAVQFSAIYQQKSAPCITAVGYNGLQVWQNEGIVSAEVLESSLEKAWLSLHIQETTASVLTAALASKKSDQTTSLPSDSATSDLASSSSAAPPSTNPNFQSSEIKLETTRKTIEEGEGPDQTMEKSINLVGEAKSERILLEKLKGTINEESSTSTKAAKGPPAPVSLNAADYGILTYEKLSNSNEQGSSRVNTEVDRAVQYEKNEAFDDKKGDENKNSTRQNKSSDVHLNIRLLDGVSLQEKFSLTSTLKIVKDYVNNNQGNGFGPYDLAIPYPRKVFSGQDLDKSLAELGLSNRQALIVVPHRRATRDYSSRSSSSDQNNLSTNGDSSSGNSEGYFGFSIRMLSYINPFSYLFGGTSSSSSRQEPQTTLQYGSNSGRQNNFPEPETPSTGGNDGIRRRPTTTQFGSNIHTLRQDEDDARFNERNSFWNGNSTQYGGDNDGK